MPSNDRSPAPAVRDSLALAELAEFALRAPHLDFGLARRRAIADALLRSDPTRSADRAMQVAPSRCHIAKARGLPR